MTRPLISTAALVLTLSAPAFADPAATPLLYEQFENSVAHVDLETCPAPLPVADTFCRATLKHEEVHVFAFSENGDSPMVGFASFELSGLETLLN